MEIKVRFKQWDCIIGKGKYGNGRIALQLIDANDGSMVAVATVNLPDVELNPGEIIIKNYSENEGMLNTLYEAKLKEFGAKSILDLTEDQLDKHDLNNTFLKLQPKDIASTDLFDLKEKLMKENNILSFTLGAPKNEVMETETKQQIEDAKNILVQDRQEMLAKYVNAVGTNGLDRELLLNIGRKICQKSQVQ